MDKFVLNVNGLDHEFLGEANWTLLYVLRDILRYTGPKPGCLTGDCGGCKVIIDGKAVNSCTTLVKKCVGTNITTIEGLSEKGKLHTIQEAFVSKGAVQCGYCTPGMVMSTKALLDVNPSPNRQEILDALDNNLCRCTGYQKIIEGVELAAELLNRGCGCGK